MREHTWKSLSIATHNLTPGRRVTGSTPSSLNLLRCIQSTENIWILSRVYKNSLTKGSLRFTEVWIHLPFIKIKIMKLILITTQPMNLSWNCQKSRTLTKEAHKISFRYQSTPHQKSISTILQRKWTSKRKLNSSRTPPQPLPTISTPLSYPNNSLRLIYRHHLSWFPKLKTFWEYTSRKMAIPLPNWGSQMPMTSKIGWKSREGSGPTSSYWTG
jgi:hypothetical protein